MAKKPVRKVKRGKVPSKRARARIKGEKPAVLVLAVPAKPGHGAGDERYVSCGHCGHEGKPTTNLDKLSAEVDEHGPGACS